MKLAAGNVRKLFELLSPDSGYEAEFSFEGYSARIRLTQCSRGFTFSVPREEDLAPSITNSADLRCSWELTSDVAPTSDTVRYDNFILGCHIASLMRLVPRGELPVAIDPQSGDIIGSLPVRDVIYVQIGNDNVFGVAAEEDEGVMVYTRVRKWTDEITPPWMKDVSSCVRLDYGNVTGAREVLNYELQTEGGMMTEVFATGTEAGVYSSLEPLINTGCVVAMDLEQEVMRLSPLVRWKDSNMCTMWLLEQGDYGMVFTDLFQEDRPRILHISTDDIGNWD